MSGRGCSSRLDVAHRDELVGEAPRRVGAAQRRCDCSANASCSSRETPQRSATFSPVSPIDSSGNIASIRGFGNRQPSVVSQAVVVPARERRAPAWPSPAARAIIDSTPPATKRSPSPADDRVARAETTAESPDAQSRFTVTPATDSGSPASSAAIRATLRLSSPAWFAAPK